MTNALEKTRTELVVETIGLQRRAEGERLQPPRAGARRRRSERSASPSCIYRWRFPLSAFIVARRPRPRAARQHHAHRQRHHRLVLEGRSRSIATTSGSAHEFGGTRTLIIALKADSADRLFSRDDAATFIEQVTGDIERVDTVAARRQPRHRDDRRGACRRHGGRPTDGGLDVRPLLEDLAARRSGRTIRRRALEGRPDSRRSRLGRRHVDRDRRQLRRGPHRRGPRRRHPADPRHRRSAAAAGRARLLQRQPRDQRDLQPHHARQPAQVHAADPALHAARRSTSRSARGARRC